MNQLICWWRKREHLDISCSPVQVEVQLLDFAQIREQVVQVCCVSSKASERKHASDAREWRSLRRTIFLRFLVDTSDHHDPAFDRCESTTFGQTERQLKIVRC